MFDHLIHTFLNSGTLDSHHRFHIVTIISSSILHGMLQSKEWLWKQSISLPDTCINRQFILAIIHSPLGLLTLPLSFLSSLLLMSIFNSMWSTYNISKHHIKWYIQEQVQFCIVAPYVDHFLPSKFNLINQGMFSLYLLLQASNNLSLLTCNVSQKGNDS